MSKTSARHQALQEFLSARGYATIEELARHFEVTPQTVRKDINALAEEGKVQRFHGGAIFNVKEKNRETYSAVGSA